MSIFKSEFFPLKVAPILEGLCSPGKLTGSHKSCPAFVKTAPTLGDVPIILKPIPLLGAIVLILDAYQSWCP